jgi:predicted glycosyltransferase
VCRRDAGAGHEGSRVRVLNSPEGSATPATQAAPPARRPSRIALYSHDSVGLGHVRRNLLLAGRLATDGHDVLLVSGTPEATSMLRPPQTDLVTLPALRKDEQGTYRARHLSLGLPELQALRRDILTSTLTGFTPDVLVVDRHARGFLGELEPALDGLVDTRVVLGLRDVLDSPARVRQEWHQRATVAALERWYDEVWVYGDRAVIPPLASVGISSPVPIRPVGYLRADRPAGARTDLAADRRPFVLVTVGGGADGAHVAAAVLDAGPPPGHQLVLVTGPQMPGTEQQRLAERVDARADAQLHRFVHDLPTLLEGAAAAVIMGGYNTVCEALATSTPTLVVPRERPRLEQRIRADALAARGVVDVLPSGADTAAFLRGWLARSVVRPRRPRRGIDLDGLDRVAQRVRSLSEPSTMPRTPVRPEPAATTTTTDPGDQHVAV